MGLIDADALSEGIELHRQSTNQKYETDRQWAVGYNAGLDRALYSIAYAKTTITPPPNGPLTLEELREMDGDKVSIHYIDGFYTDEDGAYFGKFEQLVRECNGRLTACELPLKYYGKTWLAYRRKPEEGTSVGS